jgi:hypothetical protein
LHLVHDDGTWFTANPDVNYATVPIMGFGALFFGFYEVL